MTVVTVQTARAAIMELKRPSLSAAYPESQRPRQDPAFIIAMSSYENDGESVPVDVANVVK